jgi:hypothetical protein
MSAGQDLLPRRFLSERFAPPVDLQGGDPAGQLSPPACRTVRSPSRVIAGAINAKTVTRTLVFGSI